MPRLGRRTWITGALYLFYCEYNSMRKRRALDTSHEHKNDRNQERETKPPDGQ